MKQNKINGKKFECHLRNLVKSSDSDDCARLLIDFGADINAGDNQKNTPLHTAVQYRSLPCTKIIIENGANIDSEDAEGNTPFHLAVILESLDSGNLLKENGANIHAENKYHTSPIHFAAQLKTRFVKVID